MDWGLTRVNGILSPSCKCVKLNLRFTFCASLIGFTENLVSSLVYLTGDPDLCWIFEIFFEALLGTRWLTRLAFNFYFDAVLEIVNRFVVGE